MVRCYRPAFPRQRIYHGGGICYTICDMALVLLPFGILYILWHVKNILRDHLPEAPPAAAGEYPLGTAAVASAVSPHRTGDTAHLRRTDSNIRRLFNRKLING